MCSFLPNVFNSFISLLWYITCTMFSLTMKNIKVNFFYCTYFELILYLSAVQFFSVRKTLLKSLISFTSSYIKSMHTSPSFFFSYIFSSLLHLCLKKNILQVKSKLNLMWLGVFITTYLGHSNLHLRVIGKLFKWRSYLHFKLIFFQYQFKCF